MPRHAVDQGDKFRPVDNGSYPVGSTTWLTARAKSSA